MQIRYRTGLVKVMEELTRLKDDCEKVFAEMNTKRQAIFTRLDHLDKDAGKRELRRKEVMLREMKLVLALLSDTEKTVVTEFKAEAMDKVALVNKLSENFRELRDQIAIASIKNETGKIFQLTENLESLKKKIAEVDLDFLEKSLDIQLNVNSSPVEYEAVRSQYRNLIFHSAGTVSPRNFLAQLDTASLVRTGGREDRAQFSIFHVDKVALSQDFILEKLMVTVSSKSAGGNRIVHEHLSVFEKIRRQEGQLIPESASQSSVGQVLLTVRLQQNPVEISVKLFDCHLVGSPRTLNLHLPKESSAPASDQSLSLALFDATNRAMGCDDLDEDELASHDLTGRRIQNNLNASHRSVPE